MSQSEADFSPEEDVNSETESGVTSEEIALACKGILSEDECQELAAMDADEALMNATTMLVEHGHDAEAILFGESIITEFDQPLHRYTTDSAPHGD